MRTKPARVRTIFELYLERQSMIETIKELDQRGWIKDALSWRCRVVFGHVTN
jgi:hypothetical protein